MFVDFEDPIDSEAENNPSFLLRDKEREREIEIHNTTEKRELTGSHQLPQYPFRFRLLLLLLLLSLPE